MAKTTDGYNRRQQFGLLSGPLLFVFTYLFVSPNGLSPAGRAVLASTLWIAVWWMTEAIPIPVTSLLPILLFPSLGVASVVDTTVPYADPIVFLFLGGFVIALAIERWDLHRRIALTVLARTGDETRDLILGFMLATAFLSMWVSNTATAMMMMPIGMAVIAQLEALRPDTPTDPTYTSPAPAVTSEDAPQSNFGTALMLGIAYAASIGGVATLIGTPPNAILAGAVRTSLGIQIGFVQWMLFGVPIAFVFLGVAWIVLLRLLPPEFRSLPKSQQVIDAQRSELGPMSRGERRVVAVFAVVVFGWISRPFVIEPLAPGITDTVIAVLGGVLVFLIPVDLRRGEFLLNWEATTRVPWGVLLLFGAGFSLARAFQSSGLDQWIAESLRGLSGVDGLVVLLVVTTLIVFLTEVTSNSATASLFVPLMATVSASLATAPLPLMVTVAVASSFAFMLPVATPPNAVVFGSGYVTIPQMARVGIWLNLLGILLLAVMVSAWLPLVWNV